MAKAILPALLLTQPRLGVGRQFARDADTRQEQGAPTLDPTAIGEVEILGDGIALPAAPASMAARCQMPQVPLKGSGCPAQQRVACSMPR